MGKRIEGGGRFSGMARLIAVVRGGRGAGNEGLGKISVLE